jgi:HD-GYP domain-containing protein (c-di-GMP phosphodiesterase class II)/DNA-binding CsgD family transcriptional regulator
VPSTGSDATDGGVRVVEVLAALSLTTDLASGVPFEKGLRTCAVADALARVLGLPGDQRRVVFQTALLRAVGCTAHASENAEQFVDDVAFQGALKVLDPGDGAVFGAQLATFGRWAGDAAAPVLARRFADIAPTVGPSAARSGCEVSRALGPRLGLDPGAVAALDEVYERWDGLGIPDGVAGEGLTLAARVVHVAEQAVLAHARGGGAAAVAEVRRRAGGHLDPGLVQVFVSAVDEVLAPLAAADVLVHVVTAEPPPHAGLPFGRMDALCEAFAVVADLKGRHLVGHSHRVADLAAAAAGLAGAGDDRRAALRAAALVHDLGRVVVPSSVWDRPGPLGPADRERVRLHSYWTERVLARCPATAPLATCAAAHHERSDGSGYHRGVRSAELGADARILAVADSFAALTADRAHRPAVPAAAAARLLDSDVAAGRLDRDAVAAVVEAAGLPRPRASWPAGLSEREVDVVRLAAKGLSNRQIAARLVISERTVGHHLAHVYDKTGRRTRAGVAVFAVEHGLLG